MPSFALPKIGIRQYNPGEMSRQRNSRTPIFRVTVTTSLDTRSNAILALFPSLGFSNKLNLKIVDLFFLEGNLSTESLQEICASFLCDPVTDQYDWRILENNRVISIKKENNPFCKAIEVLLRPGVTDNVANELIHASHRMGFRELKKAATGLRYEFKLDAKNILSDDDLHLIAKNLLVNNTIQRYSLSDIQPEFVDGSPTLSHPEQIDLSRLDDAGLLILNSDRRLALDLNELQTIRNYFLAKNRPASDAELETIAQTWSEHCVHKTFRAIVTVNDHTSANEILAGSSQQNPSSNYTIDNLLKTYLQSATNEINATWVKSAFVDNAGVIEFDKDTDLSFKVETHNHPSAIEPFGGANTGTGGVVRDILGVSHRPIAATDILCFGPPSMPLKELPIGVLHPTRIRSGVIAGIADYGNKLGLPTVNGAVFYHHGYTFNPLVFCGSVGIGPKDCHPREPLPNDRIVVIGGRTGRDGLRGATFSSLTMDAQTGDVAGASVQIGDPITEKGIIEVIERARDAKLYNAVTDCGAGGLSSAIGEMGKSLGASVDLSKVLLKYSGLSPWEIWLSEAQERMVLAVSPQNLNKLSKICEDYWVEWIDIGTFTSSGRLQVWYGDILVVDLDNDFLHSCPRRHLKAEIINQSPKASKTNNPPSITDCNELLIALLSHPNIASKEDIIRIYDHEVRGSTVLKPLTGPKQDGPADAVVIKPLDTPGWRGFTLSNGINPIMSEVDAYAMAVSVVDEAVRNAVAVGTDPSRIAILDNFCWGDPTRPEILGTLLQAAQGCRDAALHYGTPFISGKDSLNNEYTASDGKRRAIPGTLLISSIGIHQDVRNSVTMDLKYAGNFIYLLGEWQPALRGSYAQLIGGQSIFKNSTAIDAVPVLPEYAPKIYSDLHTAIHSQLILSVHDLSEGGLAVTAAEMSLAGRLGLDLDVSCLNEYPAVALFSETNGCFLVEVSKEQKNEFENLFNFKTRNQKTPFVCIGKVTNKKYLKITHNQTQIINLPLPDLIKSYKKSTSLYNF
jgi:phosphoribosylformylglycinamidine synthase